MEEYQGKRVIIGINHHPDGMLPEFMYQTIRLCRYIVAETDCSPIMVPFARKTQDESIECILDHVSGQKFDYFLLMKDTIYPPVYWFKYFYESGRDSMGGVAFDSLYGEPRPCALKYGTTVNVDGLSWTPEL